MYNSRTVSVVLPAYNEQAGIREVVKSFLDTEIVDEVVVVDNNSTDRTRVIAEEAGARVVTEARQGYGYACQTALKSARGALVVLVESDNTFRAKDIYKLLLYAEDFDVVFGTRTSKACIWTGSNMGWFLRYGNWAVAKLLEYVHNGPCLTDVGCTYKLLPGSAVQHLSQMWTVGRSHWSPEFMIGAIRSGLTCVEIPVHYQPRLGKSKITGNYWRAFTVGMRMIILILWCRLFRRFPRAGADRLGRLWPAVGEKDQGRSGAATE